MQIFWADSFVLHGNMQVKKGESVSCLGKDDSHNHFIDINNYLNELTLYFFCILFNLPPGCFFASVLIFKFGK